MSGHDTLDQDMREQGLSEVIEAIVPTARQQDRAVLRSFYRDVVDAGQMAAVKVKAGANAESMDINAHVAETMAEAAGMLYRALWPDE